MDLELDRPTALATVSLKSCEPSSVEAAPVHLLADRGFEPSPVQRERGESRRAGFGPKGGLGFRWYA
jgi:hypothetical protein